jgi:Uma2 family endonuclease
VTASLKQSYVSLDEYFALERSSPDRHEYRNGEVSCMGGAQPEHNTIALNLASELRARLRGGPCRPFPSDQRVKVNAGGPYLYPDVSVACEPRFVTINGLRTLVNPVLVAEVTSRSTAQDDRGPKFLQYQTIDTLTDYVLVDSTEIAVLHYRRRADHWQPTLLEHPDEALTLERLGIAVPLAEIYLDAGL